MEIVTISTVEIWQKLEKKSRERPKSAPYLRLNNVRKPLFPQLETTKALKKLKSEEKNFPKFFLKSPVSRIVPKNVNRDPLETLKKIAEKRLTKPKKQHAQKNLVKGETRTHVFLLGRPQKIVINIEPSASSSSVPVSVSGSQLIKSVTSLVLKSLR